VVLAVALLVAALTLAVTFLRPAAPRDPMIAEFHRIIDDADVSDRYEGGWDIEDATDRICPVVDSAKLEQLGLPHTTTDTGPVRIEGGWDEVADVWIVREVKDFASACADKSKRYLRIEIGQETQQCRAFVSVSPFCDL
jgi:hypothetical protein